MTDHEPCGDPSDGAVKPRRIDIILQSIDWRGAKCRSCRATIYWARTAKGANMPLNGNARSTAKPLASGGFVISSDHTHWATCPSRDFHRREHRTAPSEGID